MLKHLLLIFIFSISLLATSESNSEFEFERFNFYFENDIFDMVDEGYTNGVKIATIFKVDAEKNSYLRIPFIYDASKTHHLGINIGQDIFTPTDFDADIPDSSDRPFAGWLYVGFALQQIDSKDSDTLELQIGVVGPSSFAQDIQNGFHEMIGNSASEGWDYQLKNELGLILAYEHRWRFKDENILGLQADAIPYAGAALGNVSTYANAGLALRFGFNIPNDFGTTVTRAAQESGTPAYDKGSIRVKKTWSLFFKLHSEGAAIARNIFLDGNTFDNDSPSVEKETFVAEYGYGLGASYGNFQITLLNTYNSKKFESHDAGHAFGSVVISYGY